MKRLELYSIFHLNLAFSSIPEEDYPVVIESCYRPLLALAADGFPVALEATATTLMEIERIEPSFIKELAALWADGKCEFIGSGLAQVIMPLAPAGLNRWNLEIGNKRYEELLGKVPKVALVNEQTFSAGIVDLYLEAGYETIVMDWNNSRQYNGYPAEYLYSPQTTSSAVKNSAVSIDDEESAITVLWSHSIAFQKFQRYIYGQDTLGDYLDYLEDHKGGPNVKLRAFPLYGNDAEIFGYRPGKGRVDRRDGDGKTGGAEWERIRQLYERLAHSEGLSLTLPSEIVKDSKSAQSLNSFNKIRLTSAETPLPCKKQEKYNPTRWAVTGRDSVHINTQSFKAYSELKELKGHIEIEKYDELRELLCTLFGSDFRTNTTDEKLLRFQNRMGYLRVEIEKLRLEKGLNRPVKAIGEAGGGLVDDRAEELVPEEFLNENLLRLETGAVHIELLTEKGLAIKSLKFPDIVEKPIIGTLPHGYFDDIHYGADFFSGHLINVARDGAKITDLASVKPKIIKKTDYIRVIADIKLDIGTLEKSYDIYNEESRIDISYSLKVDGLNASSLRLGIFTLLPDAFERESLYYETVNGGLVGERFMLDGHEVGHDEPVSATVSATSCLGATEGFVEIGDKDKIIRIETDKAELYSAPILHYTSVDERSFLRLYHSIGEIDETAYWVWRGTNTIKFKIVAREKL